MRHLTSIATSLLLLPLFAAPPAVAGDIQLITRSERAALAFDDGLINGDAASISADGRFAVFITSDPVTSNDFNQSRDVLLFDRDTGEAILVSRSQADPERTGDDGSSDAVISADGSTVVFVSSATDLVSGFVSGTTRAQVFAWDRITGTMRLVSHVPASLTTTGNDGASDAMLSTDGGYVVFESDASDLVTGTDTNSRPDIFRWSRATGDIELVSRSAASPTTAPDRGSFNASMSADGQLVSFATDATDMVAGDANGLPDIFLWDAATGTVSLISESTAGVGMTGNGSSANSRISADGSAIVFSSLATDLVTGTDTNASSDIFRWLRATGTVELVSHVAGDATTAGNGTSQEPVITADGGSVVFDSLAADLVAAADADGDLDIFRWRAATGVTELLSTPDGGVSASAGRCRAPGISDNADSVVFGCSSSDLVPGTDNNTSQDVFLWRDVDGMVRLVSRMDSDPASTGDGGSNDWRLSGDGSVVLFNSFAGDLTAATRDGGAYAFDPVTDELEIISRPPAVSTALMISAETGAGDNASISADGRYVVFDSNDPRVVEGMIRSNSPDQVFLYDRVLDEMTLISRSTGGPLVASDRDSKGPSISADGSTVVFLSAASDLVTGATTFFRDQVYHWDRQTQTLRLVSHVPGDPLTGGDGSSRPPAVSEDGSQVVFASDARDLAPGTDTNFRTDIFSWSSSTGDLRVVSRSIADPTATSDDRSRDFSMTSDGRFVAFTSSATDLISGFVGGIQTNAFLWDRDTGDVELITASTASPTQSANDNTEIPLISADGSGVVFNSRASDLVAGFVPGGTPNTFHWHRATGELRLVSHAAGTTTTAGDDRSVSIPRLSADGEVVAFSSRASDLVPGQVDVAGSEDVFAWQRGTGEMTLVSRSIAGPTAVGDDRSRDPLISADGTRVLFESQSTDLLAGFSGASDYHLFLFERSSSTLRLVNQSAADPTAAPPNYGINDFLLSADGHWAAFESADWSLIQGVDVDDIENLFLASLSETSDADLELTLSTPAPLPLPPATPFVLEATIHNLSLPSAAHLYAVLQLPSGVELLGISGPGWTCDAYRGALSCGRGPLAGGASATLSLDLRSPAAPGPFSIGGSTLWNGIDPDLANNLTSFDAVVAPDDWGDAPDPGYPTLAAANGARHAWSALFLGTAVDVDVDGQPTATADGDDADGSDDEDGVTFASPLIQGAGDDLDLVASGAGVVDVWVDWNTDGDWDDPGEKALNGEAVADGGNTLTLTVPQTATLGDTFARVRLSSAGTAAPTGAAADGEVEDYAVSIEARADLSIAKGASPDPVIAGEPLTYTLTVTNAGPSPSTGATASDVLPAGVSFVSSGDGCTEAGGSVTCPVAAMAAGAAQMSSFVVAVDPGQTTAISNVATILGNEVDPVLGNNTSPPVTTAVVAQADLSVTQTDGVTSAVPGQTTLTYTVVAANAGPSDEPAATLTDAFPAGLTCTYTSVASGGATGNTDGSGDLAETLSLPAGSSVTYTAECTIDPAATGTLSNTATIVASVTDPVTGNNSATDDDTVLTPEADLALTMVDSQDPVAAGTGFTYTLTVNNAGPSNAASVVVTGTLPAGVVLVATSGCAQDPAGVPTCDLGTLAAGASTAFTIEVAVDSATVGLITHTASVTTTATDPNATNDSAAEDTSVVAESDLVVTVTDGLGEANPGDEITYTLTVAKAGPSDAPGTTVSDPFPPQLTAVSWTCSATAGSSCTAAGTGDLNDTADVAAGGTLTYVATGTLDAVFVGDLINTATATPAPGVTDLDPSNNTDTDSTTVVSPADVSGTMEVRPTAARGGGNGGYAVGDVVSYVVTLVNSSTNPQLDNPGPELLNELPDALTLLAATADSGLTAVDPMANRATWDGIVPADGMVVITIDARINYGADSTTISNQGTIFFDADGDGVNEASMPTDDPDAGGSDDPTTIRVFDLVEIPTLGHLSLVLLGFSLALAALRRIRAKPSIPE